MLRPLKPSNWTPFDLLLLALLACLATAVFDANVINLAHAAADPFAKATEKGNSLSELLRGKIAVTITGIVIAVVGILMLMSRISHLVGVRILIGAIIIGSATGVAEWMFA